MSQNGSLPNAGQAPVIARWSSAAASLTAIVKPSAKATQRAATARGCRRASSSRTPAARARLNARASATSAGANVPA